MVIFEAASASLTEDSEDHDLFLNELNSNFITRTVIRFDSSGI